MKWSVIPIPSAKRLEILARAQLTVTLSELIEQRAQALAARGFKALDALHIAAAEAAEVDYFCTCDDRLLKKAQTLIDSAIKIVAPLGLAQEVMP